MGGRPWHRNRQRGSALLILTVFLVTAALAVFLKQLNQSASRPEYEGRSAAALAEAKEALIGKAAMGSSAGILGLLPLPDLGTSRNSLSAEGEGATAGSFSGNAPGLSVVGRLPWRALGLAPLRDAQGECLWYVVSGSAQSASVPPLFNWDTLGHFEVFRSDGTPAGTQSVSGTNPHDRPLALVFSAGPPLAGQDRRKSSADQVDGCGGNYDVRNYLDSFTELADINNIVNYFPGATNHATGDASGTAKQFIVGDVEIVSGGTRTRIANDRLLGITTKDIFDRVKKRTDFKESIDELLNRLQFCLETSALTIAASAGDKGVGNLASSCRGMLPPAQQGVFDRWRDNLLYTSGNVGDFQINNAGEIKTGCRGLLFFSGERTNAQRRASVPDKDNKENYLEAPNAALFPGNGTYAGSAFYSASSASADVIRCISAPPAGKLSFQEDLAIARPVTTPGNSTLQIKAAEQKVEVSGVSGEGSACLWFPKLIPLAGKSLRAHYQFQFMNADPFATITGAKGDRGHGFTLQIVQGDLRDSAGSLRSPAECGPVNNLGALDMKNPFGGASYIVETDVLKNAENDPNENHTAIMLNGWLDHDPPSAVDQACNGLGAICRHSPANRFEELPQPLLHNQRVEIHTGCTSDCSQCNPLSSNMANNIESTVPEYARIDAWVDCEDCSDVTGDYVDAELIRQEKNRIFNAPGDWKGSNWDVVGGGLSYSAATGELVRLPNSALTMSPVAGKTYRIEIELKTDRLDSSMSGLRKIALRFGGKTINLALPALGSTVKHQVQIDAINAGELRLKPDSSWGGSIQQISLRAVRPPTVRRCAVLPKSMKNVYLGFTTGFLSTLDTVQGVTFQDFRLRSD